MRHNCQTLTTTICNAKTKTRTIVHPTTNPIQNQSTKIDAQHKTPLAHYQTALDGTLPYRRQQTHRKYKLNQAACLSSPQTALAMQEPHRNWKTHKQNKLKQQKLPARSDVLTFLQHHCLPTREKCIHLAALSGCPHLQTRQQKHISASQTNDMAKTPTLFRTRKARPRNFHKMDFKADQKNTQCQRQCVITVGRRLQRLYYSREMANRPKRVMVKVIHSAMTM